jgi:hypothetical protein
MGPLGSRSIGGVAVKSHWDWANGRRYLHCEFAGFGRDAAGLQQEIDAVDEEILRQPPESVLLLVDLRRTVTSSAVVDLLKASATRTKGYVRRQAILGVHGIQKVLAQAVAWFSGETFVLFDDEIRAIAWLTSDRGDDGVVIRGKEDEDRV